MNERMNEWMREWMNEWMNEWMSERMKSGDWENNRRAILQYILRCEQWVRTSAYKGATGSRSQSIYEVTVSTQPIMWCVGWPQHRDLRPLLFSNWGVGVSTVRRDLRNLVPRAFPSHFLREKPWGRGCGKVKRETEINQCLGGLHTRKILNNSRKA